MIGAIDMLLTVRQTNQNDLFESFVPFTNHQPVTIAHGDSLEALE